ncbi:MAG: hypothetical protein E8A46_00155 [Bradyrhizobium sp.]|uniref:hypothetical protein n=1 Tax=Bradyrhizobium sp. TaxID=376 RepID=UPI001204E1B9|nr:hypothetical protein [Bradyrhizobium sp.]THD58345.1 MAG: hypothetical protein E8A46_00155 [Bradyrhizobium sp.]
MKRAKVLFGSFRRGEANDPEIFVASLAAVLGEYPVGVIEFVTDPRTGLARTLSFIPTIKEVSDACDEQMKPLRRQSAEKARRADSVKEQLPVLDPEAQARVRDGLVELASFLKKMGSKI